MKQIAKNHYSHSTKYKRIRLVGTYRVVHPWISNCTEVTLILYNKERQQTLLLWHSNTWIFVPVWAFLQSPTLFGLRCDLWFLQAGRYATKREKPLSAQPFPSLIKPPFSAIDEQLIFVKKQVKAVGHFLTLITAALRRACYEFALFQSLSQLFVPTYFVKCRRTELELKY